jgi:hypothetical protein
MRSWWSSKNVRELLHCIAQHPWQAELSSRFSVNLVLLACLLVKLALTSHIKVNLVGIRKSLKGMSRIVKLISRECDFTGFLRMNILRRLEIESITLREKSQEFGLRDIWTCVSDNCESENVTPGMMFILVLQTDSDSLNIGWRTFNHERGMASMKTFEEICCCLYRLNGFPGRLWMIEFTPQNPDHLG